MGRRAAAVLAFLLIAPLSCAYLRTFTSSVRPEANLRTGGEGSPQETPGERESAANAAWTAAFAANDLDVELTDGAGGAREAWTAPARGFLTRRSADGDSALVACAGFHATETHARNWADALVASGAWRPAMLIAVSGPNVAVTAGTNIDLVALTATMSHADGRIVVVAHSSGTHVAHAVLNALAQDEAGREVLGRTSYVNLDGSGAGLSLAARRAIATIRLVYAADATAGVSANARLMLASSGEVDSTGAAFALAVRDSGCPRFGKWCVHKSLISPHPFERPNPDRAYDYMRFDDAHPVQVGWFAALPASSL